MSVAAATVSVLKGGGIVWRLEPLVPLMGYCNYGEGVFLLFEYFVLRAGSITTA